VVSISDNTGFVNECSRVPSFTILSNILRIIAVYSSLKVWKNLTVNSSGPRLFFCRYLYYCSNVLALLGHCKQLVASWVNIDKSNESTNLSIFSRFFPVYYNINLQVFTNGPLDCAAICCDIPFLFFVHHSQNKIKNMLQLSHTVHFIF
jgi:hypothetical protein